MKRFLVTLALSGAVLLGVEVSAGALPYVSEAQWTDDSTFDHVRARRVPRRVIRRVPVIPQQTPMRNPDYPAVPLPPPSTAVQPSVRR